MKRSNTWFRLAAVASAGALVLAACGGGTDDKTDDAGAKDGDGLVIGALLPQTGDLSYLGPPQYAGVELAIKEINDAGGVAGKDVVLHKADEGDSKSNIVASAATELIKKDVDVLVGAAATGMTLKIIDQVLEAGVLQISASNTGVGLDLEPFDKPDLYFRTAPSDSLQGAVLADVLVKDGKQNVAIMARQDAYGETLAETVTNGLEGAGAKVATTQYYGLDAKNYDSELGEVAASKPDALVLIGFDEATTIIPALKQAGMGQSNLPLYLVDGNTTDFSKNSEKPLPDGMLDGTKGTIPGQEAEDTFRERLATVNPKLEDWIYAGEAYDAVILVALAAIAADSTNAEDIASKMQDVSAGGEKCTSFKECADLLADGKDIDYDGVSGPIDFGETGSPTAATIGVYQYGGDNVPKAVEFISGGL